MAMTIARHLASMHARKGLVNRDIAGVVVGDLPFTVLAAKTCVTVMRAISLSVLAMHQPARASESPTSIWEQTGRDWVAVRIGDRHGTGGGGASSDGANSYAAWGRHREHGEPV